MTQHSNLAQTIALSCILAQSGTWSCTVRITTKDEAVYARARPAFSQLSDTAEALFFLPGLPDCFPWPAAAL